MAYKTIMKDQQSEFTEKKSIFIGTAKRVHTEEEARDFIDAVKQRYKDARHHVYAYTLGEDMNIQRYSDDGEPQGTGGLPVLDVLRKNELRNAVVVVVRYFGGILLGSSGLTRAYVRGASEAIRACGVVERVEGHAVTIAFEYDQLGKVEHYLRETHHSVEEITYTENVQITLHLPVEGMDTVTAAIRDLTAGKAQVQTAPEALFYKMEKRLFSSLDEEADLRDI